MLDRDLIPRNELADCSQTARGYSRGLFRTRTLVLDGDFFNMRTVIVAVLLALLLVFAGCASPQDDTDEGGEPGQAESPTTADNEAGAEPVNPPNETNGTESGGTVEPTDDNE